VSAIRPTWSRLSINTATGAYIVGFLFLSLYVLTASSDFRHNGDTALRYQTTQSIVDRHHIWIDHPLWTDTRVSRGVGGHFYAFYAPGQSVLMIPLYIAGRVLAHHVGIPYALATEYVCQLLDPILGALLVVLFFLFCRRCDFSFRHSLVTALLFGLATSQWPDAVSGLEQTQITLFVLAAIYAVFTGTRGRASRYRIVAGGMALGLALLSRYDAVIFLPPILAHVFLLIRHRKGVVDASKAAAALVAGFVPSTVAILAWDFARYGRWLDPGLHEQTLSATPWYGVLSLLVSPGKGIFWYVPLIFVVPWALKLFWQRHAPLAALIGLLSLEALLFYGSLSYWHGDPAWGPRYLYVVLPLLMLPLAEVVSRFHLRNIRSLVFLALGAAGILIQVSAVSVTQWRFWYRIQALEAHTNNPFQWGASHYHYYWIPRQSPILIQIDNVYQVLRLDLLHTKRYNLTARPTACRPTPPGHCPSNPADFYPVNTLAFWWADARHPLFGPHTRYALAGLLAAGSLISFLLALAVSTRDDHASSAKRRAWIRASRPA